MRIATLLLLAGTLALGACDRASEDGDPLENVATELPDEDADNLALPEEDPAAENTALILPPPAPPPVVTDDQQVLDDADATGLTSRLPESEDPAPGAGNGEMLPVD